MTPTIKRIAQLSGVSRGTVDRVLNQRGGVNAETEARVRAIAEELNYKPNLVAKSLSAKGTQGGRSIGVLLSSGANPFFDDVMKGITEKGEEIKDFGFDIKLETLNGYNIQEQLAGIDKLVNAGISGLVLTPINRQPLAEKLHELKEMGIPVVCLNTDVMNAPRACYVGSDYKQCGRVAAGLFGLLSCGAPQKIALITGSFMILGHDLRVQGFLECVKDEFPHIKIVSVVENNDNDVLSYKTTKLVLEEHPDLTGIFFSAAGVAGGLNAIEDMGLMGKIHVVCVDSIDVIKRQLKNGNLTATICQEPFKQGFEAIRVMFELLLAEKEPQADILTDTQILIKQNI